MSSWGRVLINIFFNVGALWSALRSLHVDQRGGEGISLEGRGGGRGGRGWVGRDRKEGKGRHMETYCCMVHCHLPSGSCSNPAHTHHRRKTNKLVEWDKLCSWLRVHKSAENLDNRIKVHISVQLSGKESLGYKSSCIHRSNVAMETVLPKILVWTCCHGNNCWTSCHINTLSIQLNLHYPKTVVTRIYLLYIIITRVSVRYGEIFHEPKASEISRHISQLTSVISALFL